MGDEVTEFAAPPVSEVGFSILTTQPEIIDPYLVHQTHDVFRGDFPHIERVAPTTGLAVAALLGAPPAIYQSDLGASPRWWLKSSNDNEVLQLQERFWSYNWRRNPFNGDVVAYPGYNKLKARAETLFNKLADTRRGQGLAQHTPVACELLYVDTVVVKPGMKLGDFFSFWNSDPNGRFLTAGFNVSWLENVEGAGPNTLSVALSHVQPVDIAEDDPNGYFQINFTAGGMVTSWKEVLEFYDLAHSAISHRFDYMITDVAKAEWGAK